MALQNRARSPSPTIISMLYATRACVNCRRSVKVDDKIYDSPTHKVDCFKGRVAVELEWNNKDPFFDRDLNNFRLLFELRAIEVGVIITRASELAYIFGKLGASTTHLDKLLPRLNGG